MERADLVLAVVVTYYPEESLLKRLLLSLAPQVEGVLVVDNTPEAALTAHDVLSSLGTSISTLRIIRCGFNIGVAAAQNIGIKAAIAEGFDYVLLSDQDSLPDDGMVHGLLETFRELQAAGIRVGAVGPVFSDRNTGITFPFQTYVPGKFFYGHSHADQNHPFVEAISLIASGTLLPVEVIKDVGDMREDLFVDNVDVEWCHRLHAKGWRVFGTSYASMFHHLGDARLRIWHFGWRYVSVYSPLRVYYQIRNFIALCRMPEIGWRWKVRNAWYNLGVVYSQGVFGASRSETIRMVARGVVDGLTKRMGAYSR